MAIEITNKTSAPAIDYNKVFLNNLKITQLGETRDNVAPRYSLSLEYTIYGVHEDKRYFLPKVHFITLDDYIKVASIKAQEGDPDLLIAMQAIEIAVAKILEDQTDLGAAEVV